MAVSTEAILSALATGAAGEITIAPMAHLPLVLIPALFVPFFVMLHLTALYQARRLTVLGNSGTQTSRVAAAPGLHAQRLNYGTGQQRA